MELKEQQMMKIIPLMVVFLILGLSDARADLSKKDVEEIRKIVREEVTYAVTQVEKRLDQRIDAVEKRLDDINVYLQILMAMVAVFMGLFGIFGVAFVVGWVKVSSKVAAADVTVTAHLKKAEEDKRLIVSQKEEMGQLKDLIEELTQRFNRLEKRAA